MRNSNVRSSLLSVFVFITLCGAAAVPAQAQLTGGTGTGTGGLGGGGNQFGQTGGNTVGGIFIDANGVVSPVFAKTNRVALRKQRSAAADRNSVTGEIDRISPLRKVSLVRLEAVCEDYVKNGEPIPDDVFHLAGVQRIDYVFVYPESNDLVIAGPAEGFIPDSVGRMVGRESGRPPLRLDDLVTVLRALENRSGVIGCSIDPVPENLARLKRYLAANSTAATPRAIRQRFQQMTQILGLQTIRVMGIPPESHLAGMLVEADYRMKRISLGLEVPGVRGLRSHLSMLGTNGNTMQRWWCAPLYDAFTVTDDATAFQFAGQRVQMMSQDEHVDSSGRRTAAPFTRVSTERFAKLFTDKFPELAEKSAVFAELQNAFDLAVMAALLNQEQLPDRVGWPMRFFLDRTKLSFDGGAIPTHVQTLANAKLIRGRAVVGLLGGGVEIEPIGTLHSIRQTIDSTGALRETHDLAMRQGDLQSTNWWWD